MDQKQAGAQLPQGTATDEEKEMHNRLYSMSVAMLYSKKFMPTAERVFQDSPTPAAAASTLAVALGTKLLQSAQQQGFEIPGPSLLSAGWMVMQEIAEFADMRLGIKLSEDQIEAAFYNAADQIQEVVRKRGGVRIDVSDEERQQIAEMAGDTDATMQRARQAIMPMPKAGGPRGLGG